MKDNMNLANVKKSPTFKRKSHKTSNELEKAKPVLPLLSHSLYDESKINREKIMIFD